MAPGLLGVMAFDRTTTALAFLGVIVVATVGLIVPGMMQTSTILTMVVPSMVVFGLVMLWLGVQHGEHRAS